VWGLGGLLVSCVLTVIRSWGRGQPDSVLIYSHPMPFSHLQQNRNVVRGKTGPTWFVRFQVLKATSIKMAVFWDVAPCSLIDNGRRFRGTYCLHRRSVSTRLHEATQKTAIFLLGCLDPTLNCRSRLLAVVILFIIILSSGVK
jgi:hypothetical protein